MADPTKRYYLTEKTLMSFFSEFLTVKIPNWALWGVLLKNFPCEPLRHSSFELGSLESPLTKILTGVLSRLGNRLYGCPSELLWISPKILFHNVFLLNIFLIKFYFKLISVSCFYSMWLMTLLQSSMWRKFRQIKRNGRKLSHIEL